MFKLPHTIEKDKQAVIDFMKANSFALVTGIGLSYPVATQLPLEVQEKNDAIFITGHLMKKTDHHIAFEANENVLVIFTGPHCYISASWYANPQNVSTWNYMTVHAKGKIKFMDDDETYEAIKSLTNKYESPQSLAAFNQMPKAFVLKEMKAIIGFTIQVEMLENVFKISQNKTKEDQIKIIANLRERNSNDDDIQIANEIEKRL
jgi:transcriptional regulator